MPIVKAFSVGAGDTSYIQHGSDNFTIIDCDLSETNADSIIGELKNESKNKGIVRFISTHPDEDHFGGIHLLDNAMPIMNFYVVRNAAKKSSETDSFKRYKQLRDGERAFYIHKGCKRRWMNEKDDERSSSGIEILWPDTTNKTFIAALDACDNGDAFNNVSAVFRYSINGGASFMWLGDLETDFMKQIKDDIDLTKTTIVFASHHGRESGRIPHSWLEKLDPQIIIIGEAPSRHLNYYTGYQTITQNSAGDVTMDCEDNKIHFYAGNKNYSSPPKLDNLYKNRFNYYMGSLTVETEYTL